MSAAVLAEPGDRVQVEPQPDAPADPRDAFARALLAFAAEHNVAALALVGAGVMFPNYANGCEVSEVRAAVEALCGCITGTLAAAESSERPLVRLERMESVAVTMRDVARLLSAASHLLDAVANEELRDVKARGGVR